jgi:hypothetical protein
MDSYFITQKGSSGFSVRAHLADGTTIYSPLFKTEAVAENWIAERQAETAATRAQSPGGFF